MTDQPTNQPTYQLRWLPDKFTIRNKMQRKIDSLMVNINLPSIKAHIFHSLWSLSQQSGGRGLPIASSQALIGAAESGST